MSKYIDAYELDKQGWIAARYINWEPTPLNDNFRLEVEVKPFITFSAAYVVEVVRCKDCTMYKRDKELAKANYCDPNFYCGLLRTEMDEDGYCSYGRRKDE